MDFINWLAIGIIIYIDGNPILILYVIYDLFYQKSKFIKQTIQDIRIHETKIHRILYITKEQF